MIKFTDLEASRWLKENNVSIDIIDTDYGRYLIGYHENGDFDYCRYESHPLYHIGVDRFEEKLDKICPLLGLRYDDWDGDDIRITGSDVILNFDVQRMDFPGVEIDV